MYAKKDENYWHIQPDKDGQLICNTLNQIFDEMS